LPSPSVAQAPIVTDTAAVVAADPTVASPPEVTAPAPENVSRGSTARRAPTSGNRAVGPMPAARVQSSPVDSAVTAKAVQRAPSLSADPARVDYEAQATALFNAGDLVAAREKFQLATRYSPTARAWTNYGVTLQKLGDNGGAAAAYQSAIGIDANYLEAWLYQGRLAVSLNDVARAIPMFQRARAINPRHSDVNVELARLENDAKNWTESRRFAEDAVRGDPSNARAHWYLAISTDQLQDFEVAVREYAAYLQTVGAAERDQAQFVGYARQRLVQLRGKP
jgi:tetratricopeptide (TPR) repeat protein